MKRIVFSAGLAFAVATHAAPTTPWTAAEMAQVDSQPETGPRLKPGGETLTFTNSHRRVTYADPPPPEYGSRENQWLHLTLCAAPVVVLARAQAPLSRLNSAGNMIHSKIDFSVVEVFKSDTDRQAGDTVPVLRRGSELQIDGQTLRVTNLHQPYAEGELYLLLLSRQTPSEPLFNPQQFNIAVQGDRLRIDNQLPWGPHKTGDGYGDVRTNLRRLLSFACPA